MYDDGNKKSKYCLYTVLRFAFLAFGWVVSFQNVNAETVSQSWVGMLLITAVILLWQYFAHKADKKPQTIRDVRSHSSSNYSYSPPSRTEIARSKLDYMYQMQELYDAKRKELIELDANKDTMDSTVYERERRYLQEQVDERKRILDQVAEEYRRAELEAP